MGRAPSGVLPARVSGGGGPSTTTGIEFRFSYSNCHGLRWDVARQQSTHIDETNLRGSGVNVHAKRCCEHRVLPSQGLRP
jgi:hypothetical protein